MVVKFRASAAVTAFLLSATVGSTQAAAQTIAQPAATASDSAFLQMTSSLALLHAKLGKLAEDKGSSPSVREFGKRMLADYSKVNEQLASAAKQAAYRPPTSYPRGPTPISAVMTELLQTQNMVKPSLQFLC